VLAELRACVLLLLGYPIRMEQQGEKPLLFVQMVFEVILHPVFQVNKEKMMNAR
jgi:hypothetical protein